MGYRSVIVASMSAALLAVGTVGAQEATAQPTLVASLSVEPDRAEAGDEVRVWGTCAIHFFPEGPVVPVELVLQVPGDDLVVAELALDAAYTFDQMVTIPDVPASDSSYDLSADVYDDSQNLLWDCGGDENFYVVSLDLDRESGMPGEQVNATGVCPWNTGSVAISLGGNSVGSAAVDSSTGEFGSTFPVPAIPAGSYDVLTSCGGSASFEVLPIPVIVPPVDPTLVLDPTTGYAGDGVSASGTCPVDSGSVDILFDDASVGSAAVDSSTGEFGATFPVPAVPAGTYEVDTSCGAEASFEVLPAVVVVPPVDPTLVLAPTSGHAGDGVSASGTCPVDSGSVEIFFDGESVGSATVDPSTGAFGPVDFGVPDVDPAPYDVTSSCDGSASFEVLPTVVVVPPVDPTLVLDPVSGRVGDGVSATGTCPVDSGSVEVFFDGRSVDVADVDPSTGEFGVTFTVPDAPPRSHGVTSDCGGRASFEVVATPVEPALALDPATGHVGDGLAATGRCPVSSEAAELFFGTTSVGYVAVDSSTGEFGPVGLAVPDVPPGVHDVTTDCGGRASFEVLPVEATLELDPAGGQVGDRVSATGTCPVSSTSVQVFFEGESVGSGTVDSSTGEFGPVDVDVPVVDPGAHDVTTDCGGKASFDVLPVGVLPATLELDPARGELGVDVTASGTCPLDHRDVTLLLDGRTVATTAGDPKTGEFQIVFPMLGIGGPTRTVTTSCGASEAFTVLFPAPSSSRPAPSAGPGNPGSQERPNRPISELPTPTPIDTPQGPRVIVPDLTGLTEDEVITALGDLLTLAERTGGPGVVTRQLPLPGTVVEPASEVSILLAEPELAASRSGTDRFPLALVTVLSGALISGLLLGERTRRRHARERRWLDTDVRTDLETAEPALQDVPDGSAPGLDVRLELRRDPKHLTFREVGRAHD